MKLNDKETAMILTGLRMLQETMDNTPEALLTYEQMDGIEATEDDIDALCEKLNTVTGPTHLRQAMPVSITINRAQELYIIPAGRGFTTLGFDVCLDRISKYAQSLGLDADPCNTERGSMAAYQYYRSLSEAIKSRWEKTGEVCTADLTPQLIGMEGKRVEVVDCDGITRRFWVGRSTGWAPCHIALTRISQQGGAAVWGDPFQSIRIIRER